MIYRPLGKTGMQVSVIGLGAEHLVDMPYDRVESVVHRSLDAGINIIDVFMPQEQVRIDLAKAIKGRRDKVILQGHIGSVIEDGQPGRSRDLKLCRQYFEDFLRIFETDYVDLGMMFFVDTDKDMKEVFETEYIDYVRQLKKEGKIRAVGASSHDPIKAAQLVESGEVDMLMFSINPAYDMCPTDFTIEDAFGDRMNKSLMTGIEPARARLYELCEKKGVGITVMKTLGAGRLLSAEHSPFSKALTVGQCIHYALSRPAVASCLIGCRTPEEVDHATAYLDLPEEEKDFSGIAQYFTGEMKGRCMYCNHCLPCPSHIDVAMTTKLLDIAKLDEQNIPDSVRAHYQAMENKASDCVACGSCESKCPFGVPVIENMQKAATLFGV